MNFIHLSKFVVSGICLFVLGTFVAQDQKPVDNVQYLFNFDQLEAKRAESGKGYLPFLNVSSLHCGIYSLAADAKDGQQPHAQDEIYYVESGVAKIDIEGKDFDLQKGSIVFVPAKAKHHFHSITKDLKTLVFFSKGPIAKTEAEKSGDVDRKLKSGVQSAMTFQATFDSVTDANLFDTHGFICTADSVARNSVEEGENFTGAAIVKGAGVSGDCLRFTEKTKQALFYKSKEAADFSPRPDWKGSISFWLKLDPNKDLGDGFCDPIQIAGRKWNDGAIWVDFDNVKPRTFRLGVFSDLIVWNPKGIKWDQFPDKEKPLVTVSSPPFSSEKWTHVAITFADINSTRDKLASAKLYLDGELMGTIEREIKISWNETKDPPSAIMLGLNYVGDFDDLRIFNRNLTADEIAWINRST
jgi:mannose-6-phosphate isomerase-like protein (cupin superfamily)